MNQMEAGTATEIMNENTEAAGIRYAGDYLTTIYIAIIATIAYVTGAFYVMFPELGALSHDVLTRPRGTWARSPILLAITPVVAGVIGILFCRMLPYGVFSVLLTVGGAVIVIVLLKSPIAPSISAGLLPLVLGVKSWWYPPGIMLGTVLLAILSTLWRETKYAEAIELEPTRDAVDDTLEEVPPQYAWLIPLFAFVLVAVLAVKVTGLRFILFPPLVVIGFEMFGHPKTCPWAKRPLWLPLACFLTATGGFIIIHSLGVGPIAAALSIGWGILVLRGFDLHIPPALAVALLPMVMDKPTFAYPFSVLAGTTMLTLWFSFYRANIASSNAKAI